MAWYVVGVVVLVLFMRYLHPQMSHVFLCGCLWKWDAPVLVRIRHFLFFMFYLAFTVEHIRGPHSKSCDTCSLWYNYTVVYTKYYFLYVICSHKWFGLLYDLLYALLYVRYTNFSSHTSYDTATLLELLRMLEVTIVSHRFSYIYCSYYFTSVNLIALNASMYVMSSKSSLFYIYLWRMRWKSCVPLWHRYILSFRVLWEG